MSETKRRVTSTQLHHLWEFLDKHREIAVGFNKSTQAREHSKRMWGRLADILNASGEGAVKSGSEWSKYWIDLKAKLKRKNRLITDSRKRTGGGPATDIELSEMDIKFLSILGKDYGSGLAGVQVDPQVSLVAQAYEDVAGPNNLNTPQSSTTEDAMYLEVISSEEYQQIEQNRIVASVPSHRSSQSPVCDNVHVLATQLSPSRQGTTGQSPGRRRFLQPVGELSASASQGPRRHLELRYEEGEQIASPPRQSSPGHRVTRRRRRQGQLLNAADARERLVISAETRAQATLDTSRSVDRGVALLGEMVSILKNIHDRLPDAAARGAQQDPAL